MRRILTTLFLFLLGAGPAFAQPSTWKYEWPKTDFTKTSVDLSEIMSGGPPKDGIPAIDHPKFVPVQSATTLAPTEPVISLVVQNKARAYPVRILIWHEIVNDEIQGVPLAITYCPLCNSSIVFDRRVKGRVLDFGTTGKLRRSDMVMYDRQTESWWQQFLGQGIAGHYTGTTLKRWPARVESVASFKARFPHGKILTPPRSSARDYGRNPYVGYDSAPRPFLYRGNYSGPVPALSRVVVVGKEAWPLATLRKAGTITHNDLILTWGGMQNSPLDTARISNGRNIGNVTVQQHTPQGLADTPYDVAFAFAFKAFHPNGVIYLSGGAPASLRPAP